VVGKDESLFSLLLFSMSNEFSALNFLTLHLTKKKKKTNIPVRSKIWRTAFLGCDETLVERLTRKKSKIKSKISILKNYK